MQNWKIYNADIQVQMIEVHFKMGRSSFAEITIS